MHPTLPLPQSYDALQFRLSCCSRRGSKRRDVVLGHWMLQSVPGFVCLPVAPLILLSASVGTDIRKLVLDGYKAANVAACDLRSTFIDIGRDREYGLFRDADNCEITFFAADILDLDLSRPDAVNLNVKSTLHETAAAVLNAGATFGLENLKGCLTHIYTGALFHLFDEETQYAIALRVATLLDLKRSGDGANSKTDCGIFGRHQGKEDAGVINDDMGRCVPD